MPAPVQFKEDRSSWMERDLDFLKADDVVIAGPSTSQQKANTANIVTAAKNKVLAAERKLELEELRAKAMAHLEKKVTVENEGRSIDAKKAQGSGSKRPANNQLSHTAKLSKTAKSKSLIAKNK